MDPKNGTPDSFEFSQYLDKEELSLCGAPHLWKWTGSCFPGSLKPVCDPEKESWLKEHSHAPPQRELLLVLRGSGVFGFNSKFFPVEPGSVFLFNHYESHSLDISPWERDLRHFWLHLPNRDHLSANIFSVDELGVANDTPLRTRSDSIVNLLFDAWSYLESTPHDSVGQSLLKSVLHAIFLEIAGRPLRGPSIEVEKNVVVYIEEYIESHIGESLTLTRLSKLAGYNPFVFHRIFKKHRKMTLHQHIMLRRVEAGRKLLLQGLSVDAVSAAVGLSSASTFSRFFKKQAQYSPSSWRKANRYEID